MYYTQMALSCYHDVGFLPLRLPSPQAKFLEALNRLTFLSNFLLSAALVFIIIDYSDFSSQPSNDDVWESKQLGSTEAR